MHRLRPLGSVAPQVSGAARRVSCSLLATLSAPPRRVAEAQVQAEAEAAELLLLLGTAGGGGAGGQAVASRPHVCRSYR